MLYVASVRMSLFGITALNDTCFTYRACLRWLTTSRYKGCKIRWPNLTLLIEHAKRCMSRYWTKHILSIVITQNLLLERVDSWNERRLSREIEGPFCPSAIRCWIPTHDLVMARKTIRITILRALCLFYATWMANIIFYSKFLSAGLLYRKEIPSRKSSNSLSPNIDA